MSAPDPHVAPAPHAGAHAGCLICSAPEPLLLFDASGRCGHASTTALEALGLARGAVVGSPAEALGIPLAVNDDAGSSMAAGWEITRLAGGACLARWRGLERDALDAALRRGAELLEAANRERERAVEAALEASRHASELDVVIETAADGLVVYDRHGGIQRINEAARRLLGYGEDVIGLPPEKRLEFSRMTGRDGKRLAVDETPSARALRGESVRGAVLQVRPPARSGARRWLSASAAPVRGPDGEVTGAVATFADVTLLHALREQHEDMLRMISHDLRTPLGAVVLQAELLQRGGAVTEAVQKRARAIIANAHRMAAMVDDLAELARIESGSVALRPRAVVVADFVHELVDRLAVVLPMSRVLVQIEPGLPPVLADPERLERVLVNLISNALKYSAADVGLVVRRQGGRLALAVIDRGQGIAPEEVSRVFERYYRTKSARGTKGLGLGLYIAAMLVHAHGGEIRVDSLIGKGTTFTVLLPLSAAPDWQPPPDGR